MATLVDIAKRAGVSRRTVSRILDGELKAVRSDAIKRVKRVRRIADELEYKPNGAARSTRTGKFNAVAVVSRRDVMLMQADLLRGIHDALADYGLNMHMALIAPEQLAAKCPRLLRELCVDGMIVHYAKKIGGEIMDLIRGGNTPTVWVNLKRETDCVYPDDIDGAMKTVAALTELGHRRIGYAYRPYSLNTGHLDTHYSVADRCFGYRQAMEERGLPPCVIEVPGHEPAWASQLAVWTAILRENQQLTAWVTRTDSEATALLSAALQLGWRVPQDVSVVGFSTHDGHESNLRPSAAVVPMERVGRRAVEMLRRKLSGRDGDLASQLVPYDPPTHETIGPVKASKIKKGG